MRAATVILLALSLIGAAIGGLWTVGTMETPPSSTVLISYVEDLPDVTIGRASAAQRLTNARIINVFLAGGGHLRLRAGTRVEIGQSLKIGSGGAIIGDSSGDKAVIYMPADAFDNATDPGGRYASNAVGIDFSGELGGGFRASSGVALENLKIVSEQRAGRRLRAIVGRNVMGCSIRNVEISGFPIAIGIALASARNCRISNVYIHDFADDSVWRHLPQSTGIEIDNDIVKGIGSSDNRIEQFRIVRLQLGPQLVAQWGYQTDGINVLASAVRTRIADGRISNVGEGIDTFGTDGTITNVTIANVYNFGLKFIHGASRNIARNISVTNAGLAFVLLSGSPESSRDTADNEVIGLVGTGLDPDRVWSASDSAGVLIIDNSASPRGRPRNNSVDGAKLDLGSNGDYGWLDTSSGSGNTGQDIDIESGASLQKCIFVRSGSGGVRIAGGHSSVLNLDPSVSSSRFGQRRCPGVGS